MIVVGRGRRTPPLITAQSRSPACRHLIKVVKGGLDDFCMLSLAMPFLRFHRPGATRRPTLLRRAVAWLAVGLIGLLAWLAADPAAHEFFHPDAAGQPACDHGHTACAHDHAGDAGGATSADSHDEHRCIVTAFAAGATDLVVVALFVFSGLNLAARLAPTVSHLARAAPSFRHAPSCGPPVRA